MNKKGSLAKVGTETVNGNISGTVFYDVKIKVAGAVVTPSLEVCYDNVLLVNGVPGGGKYMVSNLTSPTTPPTQIDYSVYLKSKEYD